MPSPRHANPAVLFPSSAPYAVSIGRRGNRFAFRLSKRHSVLFFCLVGCLVLGLWVILHWFEAPKSSRLAAQHSEKRRHVSFLQQSHYFAQFHPNSSYPISQLIPLALEAIQSLTETQIPDPLPDRNILQRWTNLLDIQAHPNDFIILSSTDPRTDHNLDTRFPQTSYSISPVWFTLNTCSKMFWSEYPFIREEGYRCLHDWNRPKLLEKPAPKTNHWPNDEWKYHPPTLIVARGVEITSRGYVRKQNTILIPSESCWAWHEGENSNAAKRKHISAPVFVPTQYWGDNIFHVMIEAMGRLAPYYAQLQQHPEIKIHLPSNAIGSMSAKMIKFLGFPRDRIVSGLITADAVLLPEPTLHCLVASPQQSRALRDIVITRLDATYTPTSKDKPWSGCILVIQRSKDRSITNHEEMMRLIRKTFPDRPIFLYSDQEQYSMEELFYRFRQATLIIAPHGAGLSNIIACRPGTRIVEMLTNDERIQANYALLAQQLDLQYTGFAPQTDSTYKGTITVDLNVFSTLLDILAPLMATVNV